MARLAGGKKVVVCEAVVQVRVRLVRVRARLRVRVRLSLARLEMHAQLAVRAREGGDELRCAAAARGVCGRPVEMGAPRGV